MSNVAAWIGWEENAPIEAEPLPEACLMVVDLINRVGSAWALSRMTGIDRRLLQRQAKGRMPQPHHIAALEAARDQITRSHAAQLAQAFGRLAA